VTFHCGHAVAAARLLLLLFFFSWLKSLFWCLAD